MPRNAMAHKTSKLRDFFIEDLQILLIDKTWAHFSPIDTGIMQYRAVRQW